MISRWTPTKSSSVAPCSSGRSQSSWSPWWPAPPCCCGRRRGGPDRGLFHHRGAARAFAFSTIIWLSAYVILSLVQVIANCGVTMCPADPSSTGAQSFEFTFSVSGSDGVEASISIPGFVTVMLGIGLISFVAGAIINGKILRGVKEQTAQGA